MRALAAVIVENPGGREVYRLADRRRAGRDASRDLVRSDTQLLLAQIDAV